MIVIYLGVALFGWLLGAWWMSHLWKNKVAKWEEKGYFTKKGVAAIEYE